MHLFLCKERNRIEIILKSSGKKTALPWICELFETNQPHAPVLQHQL